ncbi:Lipase 1 [Halotydeus destructor]|nr:Lipase 1 [Halotydeus destructor]
MAGFVDWVSYMLTSDREPEDVSRSIEEIIVSRGFVAELHQVTTDDGYMLTLHRILRPGSKSNPGHPVLLMHGFGGNASGFLSFFDDGHYLEPGTGNKMDNNLAFCLANNGHDVWLGNMRGCLPSDGHTKFSRESEEFWNICIDDIVANDIPKFVDHIISTTGSSTLGYVGISLGTTVMFGLLATQPKYNDIIKPFVSLAPCWRLCHMRSSILKGIIRRIADSWWRKPWYLTPHTQLRIKAFKLMANLHPWSKPFMLPGHLVSCLISGYNWNTFFRTPRIHIACAHNNPVASPKQVVHSSQYILQEKPFSKFDYGKEKNLEKYGSEEPPLYDVGKITNKHLCFMYSSNDWALDLKDVQFTKDSLNVQLFDDFLVPDPNWTHYDFMTEPRLGEIINARIVNLMKKAIEPSGDSNMNLIKQ